MNTKAIARLAALSASFLLVPNLSFGQGSGGGQSAMTPYDKLPDWSGVWGMMGGTIFDKATQTAKVIRYPGCTRASSLYRPVRKNVHGPPGAA